MIGVVVSQGIIHGFYKAVSQASHIRHNAADKEGKSCALHDCKTAHFYKHASTTLSQTWLQTLCMPMSDNDFQAFAQAGITAATNDSCRSLLASPASPAEAVGKMLNMECGR